MHLLLLYGVGNMSNHSGSSVMKPFVLNLIEDRENQQNRWGGSMRCEKSADTCSYMDVIMCKEWPESRVKANINFPPS